MLKRKKLRKKMNKKLFKHSASKVHKKNLSNKISRGGIRL